MTSFELQDWYQSQLIDPLNAVTHDPRLKSTSQITHTLNESVVNVYAAPDASGQTITQILYGEPLALVSDAADFHEIISLVDGYHGYIEAGSLQTASAPPTHTLTVPSAHIYSAPNIKSPPLQALYLGSLLQLSSGNSDQFYTVNSGGYIYKKHVRSIQKPAQDHADTALGFLDASYLWGGRTAAGIDCSGLIQIALGACGIRGHRDTDLQWNSLGNQVSEPRYGDFAFFPGHVGIMLDEEMLLHANATHMAVSIDPLADVINWVKSELDSKAINKKAFTGYRRL